MTKVSFRLEREQAASVQRWASELGVDRSVLLREAVRLHLNRLAAESDAERWEAMPLTDDESALASIADWGPAEDWSDWALEAESAEDRDAPG